MVKTAPGSISGISFFMENNTQQNIFEQATTISKAHGYDILVEQVKELKEVNEELVAMLEAISKDGIPIMLFPHYQKLIKKAKLLSL